MKPISSFFITIIFQNSQKVTLADFLMEQRYKIYACVCHRPPLALSNEPNEISTYKIRVTISLSIADRQRTHRCISYVLIY